jgi:hypothetical protein
MAVMSSSTGDLAGFAYGEDLEGVTQRSLGYRLLTPRPTEPWCDEVEALARRLQAAPYSDHWPATDLFCSVLLADGRRVVALARYGLADHTPSQRRGGLELIGVVAPAGLDVRAALTVYHWLRQRRAAADDLHHLGGLFALGEVLAAEQPLPSQTDPVPVLPVRLWQDGALLFAASTPGDPDHHLRLLEQGAGTSWQWLPLVGPDLPLQTYAQRGPLVAWTPHLAGVALKLDRKAADAPPVRTPRGPRSLRAGVVALLVLLIGLLGANLWSTLLLHRYLTAAPAPAPPADGAGAEKPPAPSLLGKAPRPADDASRERFVAALHQLLIEEGGRREWDAEESELVARYKRLVRTRKDLQVRDGNVKGQVTVAAVSVLAGRSADRIGETIRKALAKGYSEPLIKAVCEQVREQFAAEIKGP